MSELRKLEFEKFAPEIRLKIYRMLLRYRGTLDPVYGEYSNLHPAIMRTNKKIHEEAAAVLYGENLMEWAINGYYRCKMWHYWPSERTSLPRHYSRLITRVFLDINFNGDDADPSAQAVMNAFNEIQANIEDTCKKLTLNDLKYLNVSFTNSYTGGPLMNGLGGTRFPGKPYVGQNCLLPLKKVRAVEVCKMKIIRCCLFMD